MTVPTYFRAWKQRFMYQGKAFKKLKNKRKLHISFPLVQVLLLKFNYCSPMETPPSSLNLPRVHVPYPLETRKKVTPSPITNTEKKENLTTNFINDANSRLLNSRQLSIDSSASKNVISKSEDSVVNISTTYSSGINATSPLTGLTLKFQ